MASNTEQEYLSKLYQIQSNNPPSVALLPEAENPYDIDLVSRTVDSPNMLSVTRDHKAETIYFRIDRYNDYMDLSNTIGIVQYTNAKGEPHIYTIPFFDIVTEHHNGKMLFPWCIDGAATQTAGVVEYAFRFYRVDSVDGKLKFTYNLNILPAKSKVLYGMDVQELSDKFDVPATVADELRQKIALLEKREGVYWDIYE